MHFCPAKMSVNLPLRLPFFDQPILPYRLFLALETLIFIHGKFDREPRQIGKSALNRPLLSHQAAGIERSLKDWYCLRTDQSLPKIYC